MSLRSVAHGRDGAASSPDPEGGDRTNCATCTGEQRRERRAARKAVTMPRIGEKLRTALKLAEVTQDEFAEAIGLAPSGLDDILAGRGSLHIDDLLTAPDANPKHATRVARVAGILLAQLVVAVDQKRAKDAIPVMERVGRAHAETSEATHAALTLKDGDPAKRAAVAKEAREAAKEWSALADEMES
jgi:hypothetical protein